MFVSRRLEKKIVEKLFLNNCDKKWEKLMHSTGLLMFYIVSVDFHPD